MIALATSVVGALLLARTGQKILMAARSSAQDWAEEHDRKVARDLSLSLPSNLPLREEIPFSAVDIGGEELIIAPEERGILESLVERKGWLGADTIRFLSSLRSVQAERR